jgi:hypothetical protein
MCHKLTLELSTSSDFSFRLPPCINLIAVMEVGV